MEWNTDGKINKVNIIYRVVKSSSEIYTSHRLDIGDRSTKDISEALNTLEVDIALLTSAAFVVIGKSIYSRQT